MKKGFAILLTTSFIVCCFYLNTAQGLTVHQSATITAYPPDGTAHSGTRKIDPDTQRILSESWAPYKPPKYWEFTISINASGYGEVVLSLLGQSHDKDIGVWRYGPFLRSANNATVRFTVKTLSPAYSFASFSPTSELPILNKGFANEINTGTFQRTASGSASPRSRSIVTNFGASVSFSAGLTMTGPNVGVVVGANTNWQWSPGPSHPTSNDSLTASMSVNVSDTNGHECDACGTIVDTLEALSPDHDKVQCATCGEEYRKCQENEHLRYFQDHKCHQIVKPL